MTQARLFSLAAALILMLAPSVHAQLRWEVTNTFHIGGEGGWDYVTEDSDTHRLYVTRSTHTMVIDSDTGKTIADIPGQKRSHGVAIVPQVGRGFISDGGGNGAIQIFDLKTNAVLGTVSAVPDADGIVYDKTTNRVLVVSGDKGALLTFDPNIDARNGKLDPPIELGGAPEFLATDDSGKAYINLEDKNLVTVVDLKQRTVLSRWPVAPGGAPVGMALDKQHHILYIGCRNPQKLIVMDAETGKVLSALPIGAGVDATKFDGNEAFASCRDGKLEVIRPRANGNFEIVQTVVTPEGARTMDIDSKSKKIYLPTAEFEPAKPGARPSPKPGTFAIVVVSQNSK